MDRKKIIILIFALVVLFGGMFFITKSIGDRDQKNNSAQNPIPAKKEATEALAQALREGGREATVSVQGNLDLIGEKTVTVRSMQEQIVLNVNNSTPVRIDSGKKPVATAQLADLRVGDSVSVTYDKNTKNVTVIFIMRLPAAVKK